MQRTQRDGAESREIVTKEHKDTVKSAKSADDLVSTPYQPAQQITARAARAAEPTQKPSVPKTPLLSGTHHESKEDLEWFRSTRTEENLLA